jgi:hypothetical protein
MDNQPHVHIPETVSRQAQEFLRTLKDPHLIQNFSEPDRHRWVEPKLQAAAEADGRARSEPLLKHFEPP